MAELSFFETIEKRKSVRSFLDKKVENEKLAKILETINLSPSAGNLQSYKILVVKTQKIKQALADATHGQNFILQAPIALVFLTDTTRVSAKYGDRGVLLYAIQDATIAASYAQLAATALGLASVWVGAFDETVVAKVIGASKEQRPVAIIPIGYAAEEPERHGRREISEQVIEI